MKRLTVCDITVSGYGIPLRIGDVVLQVGDNRIPNIEAYYDLLTSKEGIGDAGQDVRVDVRREGQELKLRYQLLPLQSYGSKRASRRWWGFSIVLGTDIRLTPEQCGSPLIDKYGHVVGIVIACRYEYFGWGLRHVIPAETAKALLAE